METETIDLCPEGDGKFTYTQMTLQEDHFCRLVAEGKVSRIEAYRIAFGKSESDIKDNAINQWLHRVKEHRPDILAQIEEFKTAIMERRREQWLNRMWEALDHLWFLFISCIGNPETAVIAMKAYHEIAVTLGWMNGANPTASITINNSNTATAQGALPQQDANAKIAKLLELNAPKEDTQQ